MKRLLAVFVMLALGGSVSLAASRTWTSSSGRFSIQAELVDFNDGKAQLKKDDGTVIDVPLLSLSEKDREYVKSRFPGVAQEQFRPGVEYREWKSKNGKSSTLAEFLGVSEGNVQLRKSDGSEIEVAKTLLSLADQRWIADELRRLHEEEMESKSTDKASQDVTGQVGAQDIAMKLVRLDPPKGKARGNGSVPAEYIFRLITPQQFYARLNNGNGQNESEFRQVVQKEPKYNTPFPFRGVAKLGSKKYGFALDVVGKAIGYNRLYFDANANGDLTDDKPISAATVNCPSPGMLQSQFPRVDVTLDVAGKTFDYAFLLSAICRKSATESYATVSLYSAAVREGCLVQGAKRTKLLLLDHNSNGRFDDTISLGARGVPAEGDLLLINPNPKNNLSTDATMSSDRNFIGKVVCLGKSFYRMEISPAGDHVKLTPAELALGKVTNPSPAYRAVLFCKDYGVVMIGGMRNQKIPLPEGSWKVVNYTINAGGAGTAVAATLGDRATPVTVSKAETVTLPFGGPFHATVTANRIGANKVFLSLAIVGAAGEQCTSFYVNGKRPPSPQFIIKNEDGQIVHQGRFEYG
jgi:hypothetical protein